MSGVIALAKALMDTKITDFNVSERRIPHSVYCYSPLICPAQLGWQRNRNGGMARWQDGRTERPPRCDEANAATDKPQMAFWMWIARAGTHYGTAHNLGCIVDENRITGEAAEQLAKAVLEHRSLVNFGGIPIDSLRNNSMNALELEVRRTFDPFTMDSAGKGVGVPGALVLASLLPAATALKPCKGGLSHNRLVFHICSALHSLAGNGICNDGKMEGLNALLDAIKQMPQLTCLNLANNNLTNHGKDMSGVIALAAALEDYKITDLKYVCPSSNW
eukprot:3440148-Prymnesium_polylepis.1